MYSKNINFYFDSRKLKAIEKFYNGTVEGFLENELETLFEDIVPKHIVKEILDDEKFAESLNAKDKFTLVSFEREDESMHMIAFSEKTFMDVAKLYAATLKDYVKEYTFDSVASFFGDSDIVSAQTYSALSKAFDTDENINAIININIDKGIMSVKEQGSNGFVNYDVDELVLALEELQGKTYELYRDELSDFESSLQQSGAVICDVENEIRME